MIRKYFRTLFNPDMYHGRGIRRPFFEGWFYKLVNENMDHVYSVIPGIFFGKDPSRSHAFIQVMDGITGETFYHRYDTREFVADPKDFDILIGSNRFTRDKMILNIMNSDQRVTGYLEFRNTTPWPVSIRSPGIMGWYAYVPFMECNHGIVSLDHTIEGSLEIDGTEIEFSGGRGYIEKDWGTSFPEAWIWVQSNHFGMPKTSVTVSVAKIPWLFSSFRGFIAGFLHDGKLYRFATYTGARLTKIQLIDKYLHLEIDDSKHRLILHTKRGKTGLLFSPHDGDMMERTAESLSAETEVRLIQKNRPTDTILFEGTGKCSGLDINGKLEQIIDSQHTWT